MCQSIVFGSGVPNPKATTGSGLRWIQVLPPTSVRSAQDRIAWFFGEDPHGAGALACLKQTTGGFAVNCCDCCYKHSSSQPQVVHGGAGLNLNTSVKSTTRQQRRLWLDTHRENMWKDSIFAIFRSAPITSAHIRSWNIVTLPLPFHSHVHQLPTTRRKLVRDSNGSPGADEASRSSVRRWVAAQVGRCD